jgi:hypothetical protein
MDTEVGETEMVKAGVGAAVTVSEIVAFCVTPPPVPVIVIVYLPVAVFEATFRVTLEAPVPGAAMGVGLKPTVTPVGWPLAVKAMAELKLLMAVVVMVDVPLLPWTTETEPGDAPMLKLGGGAAVTVSEIVAFCVTPPPVPVMVIVYVPVAVFEATFRVTLEAPVPGAAMGVGLKPTVMPVGWPLAVKATAESKPSIAVVVMVEAPLLPWTTETELGEAPMLKVGDVGSGARALIRAVPFGLPQPVTRS